jgi:hypothetical protein
MSREIIRWLALFGFTPRRYSLGSYEANELREKHMEVRKEYTVASEIGIRLYTHT